MNCSELGAAAPKRWTRATIGDVVGHGGLFIDGDWVETKDQDPSGDVRLIQLADVGDGEYRNRSDRFLTSIKAQELGCTFLGSGDVLIARMPDPLGRACTFPGDPKPSVTVVDVCIVRTGPSGAERRWLMYQVNTPQFRAEVSKLQSGSTRKRISRGNLATIEFPLPPLPEQKRIVAKIEELFSDLDAGVEALKKAKAEIKRYRQSVLKCAFSGKLTEQWRIANSDKRLETAEELLVRIREERKKNEPPRRQERQEDKVIDVSELPKLPKGWAWTEYAQIGDWLGGGTPSKDEASFWSGGTIPWVSPKDVKSIAINATIDKITEAALKNSAANIIPKNSVLFVVRSGILKHTLPVAVNRMKVAVNQDLKALIPLGGIDAFFLAYGVVAFNDTMLHTCAKSGTTVQSIEFPSLKSFRIPLAPVPEQQQIVSEIERRFSVADEAEKVIDRSLKQAETLRQSILKRAFEGKLVPQNPEDEPAEKLLERIREERIANSEKRIGKGTERLANSEKRMAKGKERRARATSE